MHLLKEASSLVHELQKERGMTSGFLASKGLKFGDALKMQREKSESQLKQYMNYIEQHKTTMSAVDLIGRDVATALHISEHSDHPFRDYTIADFAIIRSPIPRFSGHF